METVIVSGDIVKRDGTLVGKLPDQYDWPAYAARLAALADIQSARATR